MTIHNVLHADHKEAHDLWKLLTLMCGHNELTFMFRKKKLFALPTSKEMFPFPKCIHAIQCVHISAFVCNLDTIWKKYNKKVELILKQSFHAQILGISSAWIVFIKSCLTEISSNQRTHPPVGLTLSGPCDHQKGRYEHNKGRMTSMIWGASAYVFSDSVKWSTSVRTASNVGILASILAITSETRKYVMVWYSDY